MHKNEYKGKVEGANKVNITINVEYICKYMCKMKSNVKSSLTFFGTFVRWG